MGEADLVAEAPPDGRTIVVVEVKSRVIRTDGPARDVAPERSITAHKRRKLISIAKYLAKANSWNERPIRIDVVAVEFRDGKVCDVRHHVGAVVAGK
jgi:Holliday junction resolvase-like predicted endonuclease